MNNCAISLEETPHALIFAPKQYNNDTEHRDHG